MKGVGLYKRLICIIPFVFLYIGCASYTSNSTQVILSEINKEIMERYTVIEDEYSGMGKFLEENAADITISTKDSVKLEELLNKNSGWVECELCKCIGPCELDLNGMKYWISPRDLQHPVHYSSDAGKTIKALKNSDEEVVLRLYNIINKWIDLEFSYEDVIQQHGNNTECATVSSSSKNNSYAYTLSKDNTSKLRTLLATESGWNDELQCECIGDYKLVLDDVIYIIDINDVEHQIKYGIDDGDILGAIENENKQVVAEVYEIIVNAILAEE